MKSEVHKKHKKHKRHHVSPVASEESALSEEANDSDSSSEHEHISSNTKRKQDKVKSRHHHKKHNRHEYDSSAERVQVKEEPHSSGSDDHMNRNAENSSQRPRNRNGRSEFVNVNERNRNKNSESVEKHRSDNTYNKRPKMDSRGGRERGSGERQRSEYRNRSQIRSNGGHSQERRHIGRSRDHDHRNENQQKNVKIKKDPLTDGEPEYEWGRKTETNSARAAPVEKQKPNFGLSGKLTEDANTFNGVVIKYSEPPEARKPKRRWRFYPFKGDQGLPTLYIHRQSAYLIGRDRKVVDIPVDHPSCSKQHAALQYRLVPFTRENGIVGKRVRPYIIDLESSNGTYVNNVKIEPRKYVELIERDVIKFGYSSRDYVLLHEHSKGDESDEVTGGEG